MSDTTNERLVAGHASTITVTLTDQNGEPVAAVGTVTVQVVRQDGSTVLAAGSSTTAGSDVGVYQRTLTAAQTSQLDVLTATWTDAGDSSTTTTTHAVAGGVYFTIGEARATDTALDNRFTDGAAIAGRQDVEDEFESICNVAFVPRAARIRVDGRGTNEVLLPNPMPRRLRAVWIYSDATTYTALTAAEVAACRFDPSGVLVRTEGKTFPEGVRNVLVDYEHGYTRPPAEIKRYAIKRLRQILTEATSAVPSRATSFQVAETGVFRLATAGRLSTGDPDIDGALARYSMQIPGMS